jgi:superfamily II DNA or RNA helicase/tetratricopeptide (TPR) repeat protein
MTTSDIHEALRDAETALANRRNVKRLNKAADALVDIIIGIDTILTADLLRERDGVVSMLERLRDAGAMPSGWLTATLCYITGDYSRYLTLIEPVIQHYLSADATIGFDKAYEDFLRIFDCINTSDDEMDWESFIRKFRAILARYSPGSAFELYVKWMAMASQTENPNILRKHLEQVIEADPEWLAAYVEIGYLYHEQKDWLNAAIYYEKAISNGSIYKTASYYETLGCVYCELKQWERAEKAYRLCLELDAEYQYANNNLGWCLQQQKKFAEALIWYDKSIQLGTDRTHHPYRNKFDTLKKMGRNAELLEFVKANPAHFKTKYYKAKLSKISENGGVSGILDQLQAVTESENAGRFEVSRSNSNIQLYTHQSDAIRSMSRRILSADSFSGLLVLPTGGGKTLTATYWLMQDILDKGGKIIWLAHRHELLNQAQRSFEKVCYRDITKSKPSYSWRVISGQHDKPVNIKQTDDIIIASKTSLCRGLKHLDRWLDANSDDAFLVIDEAHHSTAREYRKLIDNIKQRAKGFKMLGLTATPFRTADNEQGLLKRLFPDDIVYKIDLRELINRGILSEPIFESVPTGINMATLFAEHDAGDVLKRIVNDSFFDIETIGKETAQAIAKNRERNNAIVSKYVKNRDKYKQTLVFALNQDMAFTLSGLFKDEGVKADFVVSSVRDPVTGVTISDEENDIKIDRFRKCELEVLINVNILTEGTDLPQVQSVFLTRPTKSTILMTQMIGRALRGEKAGGTKDAYIVSFIDDWQNYIAWVNPEQLYIDENTDFTDNNAETRHSAIRLVSIKKIEEFAKLANDTLDEKVARLDFIDRIPVGIYQFTYLEKAESDSDEDAEKHSNILVYDCMLKAYEQFLAWLPSTDVIDINDAADYVDTVLFSATDMLLGYRKQDIIDIIKYYQQTDEVPEMIELAERSKYDISAIARYIVDNDLRSSEEDEYIKSQWSNADSRWRAFFGTENQKAFRRSVDAAKDRIKNADDYALPAEKPLTVKESIQIQDLTLYEIRRRFPDLGEKLVNAVYAKFTADDGYYYSVASGFRSRNRLDFQIDHIVPMSVGGKTVLDNLQLLTRAENMKKSNMHGNS